MENEDMLKQQAPSQPIDQGFVDYLQRTIKRLEQKRANIVNIQLRHGITTRFSEGVIEGLDAAIFILYDDIQRLNNK
jgi:ABC-type sulfate transport system substrate-binding protein